MILLGVVKKLVCGYCLPSGAHGRHLFSVADLIIQSSTPEAIMETAKNFLADQTKQGGKGKKTRPQEALAKVPQPLQAPSIGLCFSSEILSVVSASTNRLSWEFCSLYPCVSFLS